MSQIILQTLDFTSLGTPPVGEFYLGVDTDGIMKLKRNSDTLILSVTGSQYLQYYSITYSDFLNLYNTSSLQPGGVYLVNDFRTSHYIQFSDSVGDGTGMDEIVNYGTIEPLLVLATSTNSYDSDVKSLTYPDDEIKWIHQVTDREYDHFNNPAGTGRGHIIFRKSKDGNSRNYDFRNVVFWRWNDGSGNYTITRGYDSPNMFDYIPFKSFEEGFNDNRDNKIGSYLNSNSYFSKPYYLDNIVISTQSTMIGNNINYVSEVTIRSSEFNFNNISRLEDTYIYGTFSNNKINKIIHSTFSGEFIFNSGISIEYSEISNSTDSTFNIGSNIGSNDRLFISDNQSNKLFSIENDGTMIVSTISNGTSSLINLAWDPNTKNIKIKEPTKNIIRVYKDGTGDFTSVKDAVDYASGLSSLNNTYEIVIGPGDFYEDEIVLAPYIVLIGSERSTKIIPKTTNQNIFIGSDYCTVMKCIIGGLTAGSGVANGYSAIYHESPTGTAQTAFVVKDCIFSFGDSLVNCYTGLTGRSTVQVISCRYGSIATFDKGFYAHNDPSVTEPARILIEYCYSQGMSTTSPTFFAKASGSNCEIVIMAVQSNAVTATSSSTFLWIENGAKTQCNAITAKNWGRFLYVPISTDPCVLDISGANSQDNIIDIEINDESTSGSINGTFDITKISNSSSLVNLSYSDPLTGSFTTNKLNISYNKTTSTDTSTLIARGSAMGIIQGGDLSDNNGLTLNIATGFGYYHIDDYLFSDAGLLKRLDWGATSLSISPNTTAYVYFNNNGILSTGGSIPDTEENILLGRVRSGTSSFEFVERTPYVSEHAANKLNPLLRKGFGLIYSSGSITSTSSTPFKIDVSSGESYFSGNKFTPSGGTSITFSSYYKSATSSYTISVTNSVDCLYYNSGFGLTAISDGYYTKHSLYIVGDSDLEKYLMVYGQQEFSTLNDAQDGPIPTPPSYFTDAVANISGIIVQGGMTPSIVEIIDQRPTLAYRPSGLSAPTSHGDLLGLSNDDHTQYLLVSGSRNMSGNLNLGGNSITNVDLVDGIDITSHSSRHLPLGSDPLSTGTPSSIGLTNSIGTQNSFARQDHIHAHGNLSGGSLHSSVSNSSAGFMTPTYKLIIDGLISTTQSSVQISATAISINSGLVDSFGSLGSSSQVLSSTGTSSKWVNSVGSYIQRLPSDPSTTTSLTGVMMGMGSTVSVSPSKSGILVINVSGDADNQTNGNGYQMQLRYGTGTAPTNGSSLTGTTTGSLIVGLSSNSSNRYPFSLNSIVSGLSIGTTYWFDISLASVGGGTSRVRNISFSIHEL